MKLTTSARHPPTSISRVLTTARHGGLECSRQLECWRVADSQSIALRMTPRTRMRPPSRLGRVVCLAPLLWSLCAAFQLPSERELQQSPNSQSPGRRLSIPGGFDLPPASCNSDQGGSGCDGSCDSGCDSSCNRAGFWSCDGSCNSGCDGNCDTCHLHSPHSHTPHSHTPHSHTPHTHTPHTHYPPPPPPNPPPTPALPYISTRAQGVAAMANSWFPITEFGSMVTSRFGFAQADSEADLVALGWR